jgi:hypothetical protein
VLDIDFFACVTEIKEWFALNVEVTGINLNVETSGRQTTTG